MALVVVMIDTDHADHEDAVRSISGNLKRAGYDVLDYQVDENEGLEIHSLKAIIEACEPEVNPRANQH